MLKTMIQNLIQASKQQESYEPYKETLQKITLSGVEYFDLGYKVSDFEIGDTIRFEGIVKGTEASSISSSGSQLMLSIGNDGGQWLGKAQNGTKYAFGSSNVSTISFNEEVLADVTIALSGSASRPTFTITGSVTNDTTTSTITQRSATPTYYDFHLLFGAGTRSIGEIAYGGDYTIKCGKIYINGTKTKDYIPVLDSQMRPCLYDRVSKTFIYAKKIADGTDATSTLTYQRWNKFDVDYIESTGEQYINTGIKTSPTISFELKTAFPRAQFMLGGRSEASHSGIAFGGAAVSDKITVRYDFGGRVEGNVAVGSKVIVVTSNGKTLNYTVDENTYSVTVASSSAVVGSNDIYLFGINTAGTVTYGQGTIYYCKLFDNGTLVRDYKPTVWHNGNTTAVACLYDEVYNKMYTNAGTGSFKAYILVDNQAVNWMDTVTNTYGAYIREDGVIEETPARQDNCYTTPIPVKAGEQWTLSLNVISGNKRIHAYSGTSTSSWVSQLGIIPTSSTGQQSLTVTIPSGVNYIRLSHSTNESDTKVVNTTTYEVGKSITNGQGAGYDLSVPYSNNFVFEAITSCKTTSSNYFMDTRKIISGGSATYQSDTGAFGIGGSSSGSTMNWKDGTGNNTIIATNGTNWSRSQGSLPFKYNAKLVGWDEGGNHKRTAVFYHFGSGNNSDRVVTNGSNITNNRATVTLLYTTNSNVLGSGSDLSYIYFAQDGVVEYEVIPVRNATDTTIIGMFNKVTGSFVTRLNISGTPTQVFNALS